MAEGATAMAEAATAMAEGAMPMYSAFGVCSTVTHNNRWSGEGAAVPVMHMLKYSPTLMRCVQQ